MKKINIGSGLSWYYDNWEVLDNGSGDYKETWQNKGKCWDSKLESNSMLGNTRIGVIGCKQSLTSGRQFRTKEDMTRFKRQF